MTSPLASCFDIASIITGIAGTPPAAVALLQHPQHYCRDTASCRGAAICHDAASCFDIASNLSIFAMMLFIAVTSLAAYLPYRDIANCNDVASCFDIASSLTSLIVASLAAASCRGILCNIISARDVANCRDIANCRALPAVWLLKFLVISPATASSVDIATSLP